MELEQLEALALAADPGAREAALARLIPGSEDEYFHRCLELLHRGDPAEFAAVEALLATWVQRYGETARVTQIRDRRALLAWDRDPEGSREHVRRRLGLTFTDQRELADGDRALPTGLDPAWISRERFLDDALRHHPGLDGVTKRAHEWLVGRSGLGAERIRALLDRLERPDYPGLVALVIAELEDRRSNGFGSLEAHRLLTSAQLDELAGRVPELADSAKFVEQRLRRLWPGPDVDLDDDDARAAYLDALWTAVEALPPAFVGLQALVLFHRLDLARRRDAFDWDGFAAYLALPRDTELLPAARRRELQGLPRGHADDYGELTGLAPITDEAELIRDYFDRYFADPAHDQFAEWTDRVDEAWLRRVFAEAKLLAGVGEAERWYALLDDHRRARELDQRVELRLTPQNRQRWAADEPVELVVELKRVETLVVKVFEIDLAQYFRVHGRELDAAVDLDGLVANHERIVEISAPPLRRVRELLRLPELARPGTFVIELIGAGKSSRAVVVKGALRCIERRTVAGHALTILDEHDQPVTSAASLIVAGHELTAAAGDDGEIRVPYGDGGATKLLLRAGDRASVVPFTIAQERYELRGGINVEREQLIAGATATALIAATLTIAGVPAPLALLEHPTVTVEVVDRAGVATRSSAPVELPQQGELVWPFTVPDGVRRLVVTVTGKVWNVTQQRHESLTLSRSLAVNEIDASDAIADLHLRRTDAGYVLLVLGKTGEPRVGAEVRVELGHLDFRARVEARLQTDVGGRVELGALVDIAELKATLASGRSRSWTLARSAALPELLQVAAGTELALPRPQVAGSLGGSLGGIQAGGPPPIATLVSLLERRGAAFVRDRLDAVTWAEDGLRIRGLEPGDYQLCYRLDGVCATIRVSPAASPVRGWLLGPRRQLEATVSTLLRVADLRCDAQALMVSLAGASEEARVHVFARRFVSDSEADPALTHARDASPRQRAVPRVRSRYLSGRDIGDEYRYILDRRRAGGRLGNLAERPSLLLNPWSLRTTKTEVAHASAGSAYDAMPLEEAAYDDDFARGITPGSSRSASTSLEFLARPAVVLTGLVPDADGRVTIPRAELGDASEVEVVVVDVGAQASAVLPLAEAPLATRDLRLLDSLDPDGRFVLRKRRSCLAPGDELVLDDPSGARIERIDSLAKAHALLLTLSSNPELRELDWLTRWPSLGAEQQREHYSKHACHELDLFLARKDPAFFAEVVRPYLANKRARGLIDEYLLGESLERYRQPWAYARLNALEKALLGERIADEAAASARHLRERCELLPPDPEGDNAAFDTVLRGSALTGASSGGGGAPTPAPTLADGAAARSMVAAMPSSFGGPPGAPPTLAARPAAAAAPMAPPPRPAAPAPQAPARKRAAKPQAPDERERADLAARAEIRRFYQPLDKTEEWAETYYYRRRVSEQTPELIPARGFWRDYAEHVASGRAGPFLSAELIRATGSFAELMSALALVDLPFVAEPPEAWIEGGRLRLRARTPMIVFHEQIEPAEPGDSVGVLVSHNFLRADERSRYAGNQRHDKPVRGELLVDTVYAGQIVLTNPSALAQPLDLLVQIPQGAIAVADGRATRDVHVQLEPWATKVIEYSFYFPRPGLFVQAPIHVAQRGILVASTEPLRQTQDGEEGIEVVRRPRAVDAESWAHVSQRADDATLLAYLEHHNLERVDLSRIAWRMRDRAVFEAVLALLRRRHVYVDALWRYAVLHADRAALTEYLGQQHAFLRGCGLALDAPLVTTDAVERRWYQHLEYAPLVNARAHAFGGRRKILNGALADQYRAFLLTLIDTPQPSDEQWLAAVYYLLVQDRVSEAEALLGRIDPARVTGRLQWDYLHAWLALGRGELDQVARVAERWASHPVPRWQRRFAKLLAIVAEARGTEADADLGVAGSQPGPRREDNLDREDRQLAQQRLAASEATLDFEVEGEILVVSHPPLAVAELRAYLMDIELLFSRQPFMRDPSGRFGVVQPNYRQTLALDRPGPTRIPLPEPLRRQNAILELVAQQPGAAGVARRARANYAHDLAVHVVEAYGQLRVQQRSTGAALRKIYVKVYGREHDGRIELVKDGYTDVRGLFDYASLSTDALDRVERLAILIHSDEHGALVREVAPPQR